LEDVLKKALAEIKAKEAEALHVAGAPEAFVITEEKTDRMHLKKAFESISYKRRLKYSEADKDLGDEGLLRICETAIHGPMHVIPSR
jgi:aspartyl/asparaginyl-tRNA synthetase